MIIESSTLIAFSIAAFALVVTPGSDTLLILHRSGAGSVRLGLATVAGIQFGLVFHTLLAVLGLSVLIASSPVMFKGIALVGSLYLGWLAVKSMKGDAHSDEEAQENPAKLSATRAWFDAMLCNILNPKVILMYLALMPNFINVNRGSASIQLLILGIVMISINTVWQVPLSLAANAASRWLRNYTVRRTIDWMAGGVLMLFAVLMCYEHFLGIP